MKNSTLVMVGILEDMSVRSAALAIVPMQQASAQDTNTAIASQQSNTNDCRQQGFQLGNSTPKITVLQIK